VIFSSKEIFNNLTNHTSLNLYRCSGFTRVSVKCLSLLTNLVELDLSRCVVYDELIQTLPTTLQYLSLQRFYQITDQGCLHLSRLVNLTHLNLSQGPNLKKNHHVLTHLTKLIYLNLFEREFGVGHLISDSYLHSLCSLVNIQVLFLSYSLDITDIGIANLTSLSSLINLECKHCPLVTLDSFKTFKQITNLNQLRLTEIKKGKEKVGNLKTLGNLTALSLKCCLGFGNLNKLRHLTKLKQLKLIEGNVEKGLSEIQHMTKLQHLNLFNSEKLSDKCLSYISLLSNLNHLRISLNNRITDKGLDYVRNLKSLRHLGLSLCDSVSGNDLAYFETLSNLGKLNIHVDIKFCENANSKYNHLRILGWGHTEFEFEYGDIRKLARKPIGAQKHY